MIPLKRITLLNQAYYILGLTIRFTNSISILFYSTNSRYFGSHLSMAHLIFSIQAHLANKQQMRTLFLSIGLLCSGSKIVPGCSEAVDSLGTGSDRGPQGSRAQPHQPGPVLLP